MRNQGEVTTTIRQDIESLGKLLDSKPNLQVFFRKVGAVKGELRIMEFFALYAHDTSIDLRAKCVGAAQELSDVLEEMDANNSTNLREAEMTFGALDAINRLAGISDAEGTTHRENIIKSIRRRIAQENSEASAQKSAEIKKKEEELAKLKENQDTEAAVTEGLLSQS